VTRLVAYLLLLSALAPAVALARRRPIHVPVAALLGVELFASSARFAIVTLAPLSRPWFHIDQSLFLLAPLGLLAAVVAAYWAPIYAAVLAPVWALLMAALVVGYRGVTPEILADCYFAITAACVLGSVAVMGPSIALWFRRRERPGLQHLALALLVGAEFVGLMMGPWRFGIWSRWDLAQWSQIVVYGVLTVLQGGAMIFERPGRQV
jgi:hypothetical protein